MSFTVEQVNKAIVEYGSAERFADRVMYGDKSVELPEIGWVEYVDSEQPVENGSRNVWIVFRVVSTGQLFEMDGNYDSWDGTEWNPYGREVCEVEPFEVTIERYRKVNGNGFNHASYH